MERVKRPYDSARRRQQAAETRNRLASNARALFAERGYAATSIESIAAAAGLSPRTFYTAFGSKRNVLFALLGRMAPGGSAETLNAQLTAVADNPRRQLALMLDYVVGIYAGGADLLNAVRSAGATDPDLAAVAREGDRRRRSNQATLVRAWAHAGLLRAELSIDDATDILWTLTSPELYHLLIDQRRWPRARHKKWLLETLTSQLLPP